MQNGKKSKARDNRERSGAIFFRPEPADYAELKRRQSTTGAPLGAQVRIIVHSALAKTRVR
jgi:hypothetical protein